MKNYKKYIQLKEFLFKEQDRNIPNDKLINELSEELDFLWHKKLTQLERDQIRKIEAGN